MTTGKLTTKLMGVAIVATAGVLSLSLTGTAQALPLDSGNNNLSGAAVGLAENYVRPVTGTEYVAPSELPGPALVGTQMPGHFESIRTLAGVPIGINIAQPGKIDPLASGDARGFYPTPGAPAAYAGLPIYGARNGVAARFDTNTTTSNIYSPLGPLGSVNGLAYNLTPNALIFPPAFGGFDAGGGPGQVAGDGFADFSPFIGNTALALVTFFDKTTDPSGALGVFTPHIKLYEGGAGFTLAGNGAALDEADWSHATGPTGGTLASAIDGTLLLEGDVITAPVGTLSWALQGTGTVADPYSVLFSINASGGIVEYTGGSLVTGGQVALGSTGSFGFNVQQILFVNTTGIDPLGAPDQWDFLPLNTGSSSSGNLSLTVQTHEVPEPATAGLGLLSLMGLGAYATRRRRA